MVVCIMVLYKPDKALVLKSIGSIEKQVDRLILVNNSEECFAIDSSEKTISVDLFHNHGIAYAQNRGIERALELGADYILLSDQDTVYPADYISSFRPYMDAAADILVPVFYDHTKQDYEPVMVKKFRAVRL